MYNFVNFCIDKILDIIYNINMKKVKKPSQDISKDIKKEAVVPKTKGKIFDRILTIGCATMLGITGFNLTRGIILSNKQYLKPISQVERDAELFGADLDIMSLYANSNNTNELIRLKHNNGEPIYVSINENIKNEKVITNIHKSLDYVESFFKDINDKYKFQIVSEATANFNKTIGKTVIKYQTSTDMEDATHGINKGTLNKVLLDNLLGSAKTNVYNIESIITVNENSINQRLSEDDLLTVLIHELLHSFGLGDVYTGDLDRLTFMNVPYGFFSQAISPNDLRNLYSAYCENHIKENGEIDIARVDEINEKLNAYEKEYFNYISKKIITEKHLTNITSMSTLNGVFSIKMLNNTYFFNIENNTATLNIFNANNKLEKTYTGEVLYGENNAVLKGFYDETNQSTLKLYFSLFKTTNNIYTIAKIDNQSVTNISFLPRFPEIELTK